MRLNIKNDRGRKESYSTSSDDRYSWNAREGKFGAAIYAPLAACILGYAYRRPVSHAVDGNPQPSPEGLTLIKRHGKIISVIDYVEDSIWRVW